MKDIFAKNSAKNNQFQQKIEICKLHIGLDTSGVSGWLILLHMITKHHFRVSNLHKRQKRCILLGVVEEEGEVREEEEQGERERRKREVSRGKRWGESRDPQK